MFVSTVLDGGALHLPPNDGICVFAALCDENMCSLVEEILGCRGKVESCPIMEARLKALDQMFIEMESVD